VRALAAAAVLAALVLAATTGAPAAEAGPVARPSIVGGGPADPAGWSFAVALRLRGTGFFCTGSLIAPDRVLTAAHCVRRTKVRRMRVIAGSPWIAGRRRGVSVRVRRVRIDPHYDFRRDRRDLAVLTLRRSAPGTPIELATRSETKLVTRPGHRLRSAGWGARSPWGFNLAKRLKSTRERALPNSRCQRFFGKRGYHSPTMICALGAPVGRLSTLYRIRTTSCSGDSGGPLVAPTPAGPRLVGVVSAGPIPCGAAPSIYARISAGRRFIDRELGRP
jgi:secreted trypsin-like serine protease